MRDEETPFKQEHKFQVDGVPIDSLRDWRQCVEIVAPNCDVYLWRRDLHRVSSTVQGPPNFSLGVRRGDDFETLELFEWSEQNGLRPDLERVMWQVIFDVDLKRELQRGGVQVSNIEHFNSPSGTESVCLTLVLPAPLPTVAVTIWAESGPDSIEQKARAILNMVLDPIRSAVSKLESSALFRPDPEWDGHVEWPR